MSAVLQTTNLSVRFGGVHAVSEVDLTVEEGQLVGLIGPNGAGKTTFIDAITGFVRSTGGVTLDGQDITRLTPHQRARRGLGRTWQASELFDDLTVRENLLVAARRPSLWGVAKELFGAPITKTEETERALELVDLTWAGDMRPTDLSQGQRKLVGVARAIAMQPRLLCLDEPAAGLDTHESEDLGRRLRSLVDGGQSMLLIDHDMGLVMSICDQIFVLEFGKLIASGPPDVVRRDPEVIKAYLGSAAAELADEVDGEPARAADGGER